MKEQFKTPVIEVIEVNSEEIIKTSGFYAFWNEGTTESEHNYEYKEDQE